MKNNLLFLLPFLFNSSNFCEDFAFKKDDINQEFNISSSTLISVKEEYVSLKEYRIYFNEDEPILSIGDNAFTSCDNIESLMLSTSIETISSLAFNFDDIKTVYYTGSLQDYSSKNFPSFSYATIYEYAFDEGFINYWDTFIRPTSKSNICEISKSTFYTVLDKYQNLSSKDKNFVDNYKDKSGTNIAKSISYLKDFFSKSGSKSDGVLSQEDTIALIVGIAIFGMTTISIFYMLKMKKIID